MRRGALNIAIEGNTVSRDFDAPGDDILGFETEAKTPEQKAALDAAIKTLSSPADLFVMPAAAGCKTATAKVEVNMSAAGHSEFEGKYTLTCADPAKITDIDFKLFKAFPKADKVTVTVISAKGQQQFDATPKKPKVDLAGVM